MGANYSAPRAWSYLVLERLAGVQEVRVFYAVRRRQVLDCGPQLGGDAGKGVSRLHHVGSALTVRRVLRGRCLGQAVRPRVGGVARAVASGTVATGTVATGAARDGVVHVVHAGVGKAEVV